MPRLRPTVLSLVLALAFSGATSAYGQGSGATSETRSDASTEVRRAQVAIDGDSLFFVRGVTALPAEARASQIEDRIRALAADPKISANSLILEEHPAATWILANGQRVMAVLDEDAAIEEIARQPLAELYKVRIGSAINEYRENRRPGLLWLHALYALGASIVLFIVARLSRRIVAFLHAALERRYRARIQDLEGRAFHLVKGQQVWHALASLLNVVWGLGIAMTVYFYLSHVLALFPWTRGFALSLFAMVINPIRTLSLGFVGIIPNLIFLVILTVVTRYVLRLIRALFDGLADGSVALQEFDREWALPTYRLVRALVVALALVVAYPYIPGSESGAFKGISLFVGIIFSLGSSSLVGNFIAGYSMTYRRTFKVGDRVKIGEHVGVVERIRLMVTHLRTIKNEEVLVPNSLILGAEVVNYSSMARQPGLILHTMVGIRYEVPWRQVEAMLLEAATRTEGLCREPEPFAVPKELGEFYVKYELNVFCDTPTVMEKLYAKLHRNILDVFNEYGVQIMTPAYEGDPDEPKVVPRDQWSPAPARAAQNGSADQAPALMEKNMDAGRPTFR